MRPRPDLIVPIRDRRQHVRIVTLRNFWRALLVVVVLFGATDLVMHLRHTSSDDFGRLSQGEMKHEPVVASRAPAVVTPAPIADAPSADPFLIEPAAREQQFLGTPAKLEPAAAPVVPSPSSPASDLHPRMSGGEHVAIVGDGGGVSIRTSTRSTTPKLSGGIFR